MYKAPLGSAAKTAPPPGTVSTGIFIITISSACSAFAITAVIPLSNMHICQATIIIIGTTYDGRAIATHNIAYTSAYEAVIHTGGYGIALATTYKVIASLRIYGIGPATTYETVGRFGLYAVIDTTTYEAITGVDLYIIAQTAHNGRVAGSIYMVATATSHSVVPAIAHLVALATTYETV